MILEICLCNILFLLVISFASSAWKGSAMTWSVPLHPWWCLKLSLQHSQAHLRLFGKYIPESKELILKCIKWENDTFEIMSITSLRAWSQFVHLKVKLLSCDFGKVNHSTSFVTNTLADISFSQCSTLVTLQLFHMVVLWRRANCSLRKDAAPLIGH